MSDKKIISLFLPNSQKGSGRMLVEESGAFGSEYGFPSVIKKEFLKTKSLNTKMLVKRGLKYKNDPV